MKFCPECGNNLTTERVENRDCHFCRQCDKVVYLNPKPCAGVVVIERDELLLIKRQKPPARGCWSLPAGFLEVDEPPDVAAARELEEESGLCVSPDTLTLSDTKFKQSQKRENILVIIYQVSRSDTSGKPEASSDALDARFWNIDALAESRSEDIEPGYKPIFEEMLSTCSNS